MRQIVETKLINPLLNEKFELPRYVTRGSAGLDLRACIENPQVIGPGQIVIIPSGIAINIKSPGLMGVLVPRSGLGTKGLVLANLCGIIDSDYQGEIKISVWNRTHNVTFTVNPGERICQMIFVPIVQVELNLVEEFSQITQRADGGFGHSGLQ